MFAVVSDFPSIRSNCPPTAPLSLYQVGCQRVIITIIVSLYFSFTNYTFIISRFSNCSAWPRALSPPMMDGRQQLAGKRQPLIPPILQNMSWQSRSMNIIVPSKRQPLIPPILHQKYGTVSLYYFHKEEHSRMDWVGWFPPPPQRSKGEWLPGGRRMAKGNKSPLIRPTPPRCRL